MPGSDQLQFEPRVAPIPAEQRAKLRVGFALCSSAFALALAFTIVSIGAVQFASSSDAQFRETHDFELRLAGCVASAAIDALLIGGLACLYRSRNQHRWRLASTVALMLVGADVATVCVEIFGTDAMLMALTRHLGLTLNWVMLWMIAILAAETAESDERPDLTFQTEVTGRLVLWGATAWLAYMIWSFDPKEFGNSGRAAADDDFSTVLFYVALVLQLFAYGRTIIFCGGLTLALSPRRDSDQSPPAQTA